uniref:Uncharacterized protein n=1 Tax=Rhizophora mucronata TaxID=61149 RepID=A0A2P2JD93_RHIMU
MISESCIISFSFPFSSPSSPYIWSMANHTGQVSSTLANLTPCISLKY